MNIPKRNLHSCPCTLQTLFRAVWLREYDMPFQTENKPRQTSYNLHFFYFNHDSKITRLGKEFRLIDLCLWFPAQPECTLCLCFSSLILMFKKQSSHTVHPIISVETTHQRAVISASGHSSVTLILNFWLDYFETFSPFILRHFLCLWK